MYSSEKLILSKRPDESFPSEIKFFQVKKYDISDLSLLDSDHILLKILYLSIEPVARVWLSGAKTYINPIEIGDTVPSFGLGEVIYSKNEKYKKNDVVLGMFACETYHIANTKNLIKFPFDSNYPNLHQFLSIFGPTGLTAYLGLKEVGKPKSGNVLCVSAAAGSCGSMVVQLGKRWGCKVIGIAGSESKCEFVCSKLGADYCLNYKDKDFLKEMKIISNKLGGIDIFFDNVGEESLDAVLDNININAKIILCGAMATYGNWKGFNGLKNYNKIIEKRAVLQGILYFGQPDKLMKGLMGLMEMNGEKEFFAVEEILNGIENWPIGLQKVYFGKNYGKIIIKVFQDNKFSKL